MQAKRWGLGGAILLLQTGLAVVFMSAAQAATHEFDMTIEDTEIRLVGDTSFHTFAFNGQVPAPMIHVKEDDDVVVNVMNLTTLPHTIHWHGLLQRGTWRNDGVPNVTQKAIEPGETYTYRFKAEPSGTMWFHCHVNVNEHVVLRGMWGPFIIDPKEPTELEKRVTKDFTLMYSDWASQWAHKPGYGGVPGDVFDYFTINGKSFPDIPPMRVKKGDFVRMRLIGSGDLTHSIHLHGHVFLVAFKDGHALPQPYKADTILIGPGERYDIFFEADNPGRWVVHDHVDTHMVNGDKPKGGSMTVVEYEEIADDKWYVHHKRPRLSDFYYETSITKPHGMHGGNDVFVGTPVEE